MRSFRRAVLCYCLGAGFHAGIVDATSGREGEVISLSSEDAGVSDDIALLVQQLRKFEESNGERIKKLETLMAARYDGGAGDAGDASAGDAGDASGSALPKFYMYEDAGWISNEQLLDCWMNEFDGDTKYPWLHEKEDAQNSGDIWVYYNLKNHPSRTMNPDEAKIFYVPYLVRISALLEKECAGTTHSDERHIAFVNAVNQSKIYQRNRGKDHLFVCQSWECYDYLQQIKMSSFQEIGENTILREGYIAIHENNPRWTQHWAPERIIVIPYNANSKLLALTDSLTLQDRQNTQFDYNIYFASGHCSGNAIPWSNCNRSIYNSLNTYPDNVIVTPGEPECAQTPGWCCDSHKCHNKKVIELFKNAPDMFVSYAKFLQKSRFNLMGCGDTPTSRRFSDAIAAGTIPLFPNWRYFHEEEGMTYGQQYAWRHGTSTMPHVSFPWKISYDKLSVLIPELTAYNTQMAAVEDAVQEVIKSGEYAKKQKYLFDVRDDLVYGWGSPVKAAEKLKKGEKGGSDRFGRVAENLVYEAYHRINNMPLPYLQIPIPYPRA
jgi:hypothetical protein